MSSERSNDKTLQDAIAAFLDFLEGNAPRPSIAHLPSEAQGELANIFRLMEMGRSIDPSSIPPPPASVGEIAPISGAAARILETIRGLSDQNPHIEARFDEMRPDLVLLRVHGLRIHVVIRTASELTLEPTLARGLAVEVLRSHLDATAVVVVTDTEELECRLIEPRDLYPSITTPAGIEQRPRLHPVVPLRYALDEYLDRAILRWDPTAALSFGGDLLEGLQDSSTMAARQAVAGIVAQGMRARDPQKRSAWTGLGEDETRELAELALALADQAMSVDELDRRLDSIVGDAA